MIKIIFTTVSVILAISFYFLKIWYEEQNLEIEKLNREYTSGIKKIKEIHKINSWLRQNVQKNLKKIPKSAEDADERLIQFFDMYAKTYNLVVDRFIYEDEKAHYINLQYKISKKNYKKLLQFMNQEYQGGYFFIKSFAVDKKVLQGKLIIIQPYFAKETSKGQSP
ncbi:MAG TPA: hypothetical protein EYH11_03525 [Sulfurimonas autotrophica]|nr:hypothetical protein [Sulfurimonas autotrophica]